MAQFKIYGQADRLHKNASRISDVIHRSATDAFGLPEAKRFHRFIPMDDGMFFTPDDRSDNYIIIECVMFEGRSVESKKEFYRQLLEGMQNDLGIGAQDIEVTLIETPRHDWLIRGGPGDEIELNYKVET